MPGAVAGCRRRVPSPGAVAGCRRLYRHDYQADINEENELIRIIGMEKENSRK